MNIRKIQILTAVAMLTALPVLAFASTSRLAGMNLPGDYTKDYTAFYAWPACINDVGNLVYGEMGSTLPAYSGAGNTLDRAMGAVLPNLWDGRYGVWSISLREEQAPIGQGSNQTGPGQGDFGFDPNNNTNQSFDIAWGKKFGTNNFGLAVTRAHQELSDELPGVTSTYSWSLPATYPGLNGSGTDARNVLGFGAGLAMEVSPKTTAEFSALFQSRKYEASQTAGDKYTDNGGSNYVLGARAMWKWQPNVVVVPVLKYYTFDLGQKQTVASVSTTADNSLSGWQLGLAGNWAIGTNDLFVLGGTLANNTIDQESDALGIQAATNGYLPGAANDILPKLKATESLTPMVFMALETQVNSWLTLRMGANKGVNHQLKVEGTNITGGAAHTVTMKSSSFKMNAGCSVKVGSLTFDAVLDDLFFTNPVAQTMGNTNASYAGNNVFNKVSATYTW